jgi:hypothetical protein
MDLLAELPDRVHVVAGGDGLHQVGPFLGRLGVLEHPFQLGAVLGAHLVHERGGAFEVARAEDLVVLAVRARLADAARVGRHQFVRRREPSLLQLAGTGLRGPPIELTGRLARGVVGYHRRLVTPLDAFGGLCPGPLYGGVLLVAVPHAVEEAVLTAQRAQRLAEHLAPHPVTLLGVLDADRQRGERLGAPFERLTHLIGGPPRGGAHVRGRDLGRPCPHLGQPGRRLADAPRRLVHRTDGLLELPGRRIDRAGVAHRRLHGQRLPDRLDEAVLVVGALDAVLQAGQLGTPRRRGLPRHVRVPFLSLWEVVRMYRGGVTGVPSTRGVASAAAGNVCPSRSGVRCMLWGSPRPKAGGVPAGSPRTGRTWAFGRCGEWGSPLLSALGGLAATQATRIAVERIFKEVCERGRQRRREKGGSVPPARAGGPEEEALRAGRLRRQRSAAGHTNGTRCPTTTTGRYERASSPAGTMLRHGMTSRAPRKSSYSSAAANGPPHIRNGNKDTFPQRGDDYLDSINPKKR